MARTRARTRAARAARTRTRAARTRTRARTRAARAARTRTRTRAARAWVEFIAGSLSQSLSCRFLAIHHTSEYPSITAIAVITITLPQNTNGGIVAM